MVVANQINYDVNMNLSTVCQVKNDITTDYFYFILNLTNTKVPIMPTFKTNSEDYKSSN